MSSDPQSPPPENVVEFGAESEESRSGRRRWNATEMMTGLAADRRAVPLAAAVGGVALFAALISEWQLTQIDAARLLGDGGGSQTLTVGVADLGALGSGFLAGVFLLTATTVLVLFGPTAGRGYARLIGLSTGGVLLALLAALASTLGDRTRAVEGIFVLEFDDDQLQLSYGRGIWCAFFGVAAVLLALYLSARHQPDTVAAVADPEAPGGVAEAPAIWSWRRPRGDADEQPPDEPFDLTVSSAKPFTPLQDNRDSPTGRDDPH